ncbi:MAG: carboxyl transferase domain-containing protein [Sterolibacterium sp.]|jgi:acetyl-CoA carboxylase carboxyltransferase component
MTQSQDPPEQIPDQPNPFGLQAQIDELHMRRERAARLGGADKLARRSDEGLLNAHQRIALLVDPGSFSELGSLSHSEMPGMAEKSWGDGLVIGIGSIDGRPVAVNAADKTVFAATEGQVHFRKALALHDYAVRRGMAIFNLGEGGGLRMPDGMGSDGISLSMMPVAWNRHDRAVPILSAILGDSFGGPTWLAMVSDFVVQAKGTCMAVAGPRMLEIATGEKIGAEELGGWKIHAETTGQADASADTEQDAILQLRRCFSYLPSHAGEAPPVKPCGDDPLRRLDELVDIVPTQRNRGYDMLRVIRLIVDDGEFFELKPLFGRALITCLARLGGRVVGIIASQPMRNAGAGGPDECDKAIDFTCLCDSFHIPLVYLHDTPGFAVGSRAEQKRMPTKIMVWNQANAHATVPRLSVVIRKSIGAAYGNMMGPQMGADAVVVWPSAEINFTGPEVGINVVYGRQLAESTDPAAERQRLLERWSFDSSPYKAAGRYLIDDVIDPRETRSFLCRMLEQACRKNSGMGERRLANWPTGF